MTKERRMVTARGPSLIVLTIWMMSGGSAAAETIRDEATSLTISAPDGYVVQRTEQPPAVHAAARFPSESLLIHHQQAAPWKPRACRPSMTPSRARTPA